MQAVPDGLQVTEVQVYYKGCAANAAGEWIRNCYLKRYL